MTTLARQSINRLARERAQIDPDREVCSECRGSGRGDYGPCPDCDGFGSWLKSDLHERPDDEAACLAWASFFPSSPASPCGAGEAAAPRFQAAASSHSNRKAA